MSSVSVAASVSTTQRAGLSACASRSAPTRTSCGRDAHQTFPRARPAIKHDKAAANRNPLRELSLEIGIKLRALGGTHACADLQRSVAAPAQDVPLEPRAITPGLRGDEPTAIVITFCQPRVGRRRARRGTFLQTAMRAKITRQSAFERRPPDRWFGRQGSPSPPKAPVRAEKERSARGAPPGSVAAAGPFPGMVFTCAAYSVPDILATAASIPAPAFSIGST
jgi:hypothetical protein